MKVTLFMAVSPNGYVAREDGDEDWVPIENWDDFLLLAKKFNNIVMGRETYEQVTSRYGSIGFHEAPCDHKIIVTRNMNFKTPAGYSVVHSPEEALRYIESKGLPELFLIGGGKLNTEFIKRGLISEIIFIINPYIIGAGRPALSPDNFDISLELKDSQALSKGRLRLHYKVLRYAGKH